MSESKKSAGRPRRSATAHKGVSNKSVTLHRSFGDRIKNRKLLRSTRKAAYLSTLPKEPWKRILHRMHPKRVIKYWFSREGAIMALKITGVGIVAGFLIVIGLFAYFRKDLPKIKDISGDKLGGSNVYMDRTDKILLWQDYDTVKRTPVEGNNISPFVKQATVAIEDKDFYNHGAFDVRGITRAGVHDVFGGGAKQGGSTITQQLVKLNQQWTDNRTITRKVKELILAVELEREYKKDDILNAYLNIAPYGGVEYGVEAASQDYFGVSAKNITLAQAAMLAAIPKAPSTYSPYGSTQFNPDAGNTFDKQLLKARSDYILDQMVNQKLVSRTQADAAKKTDILAQVKPLQRSKYTGIKAPYFVQAAKHELAQKYGSDTVKLGGWHITTTLDMALQDSADQLVQNNIANVNKLTRGLADEQATVLEEVQTGQIKALVGGTDFNNEDHGQNNYAASEEISPGSSFKPYDYATLIDNNNNVGAGSVFYDTKQALPGYPNTCDHNPFAKGAAPCADGTSPAAYDYDNKFPGPVTLRYALGGSRNIPAIKAMYSADPNDTTATKVKSINKVISTASAMMANQYNKGSAYNCYSDELRTVKTQCYGASAIGDGSYLHLDDHVNGLSTIARLGKAIPRTYILSIKDSSTKEIYKWTQPKPKQVIKEDAAYIVNDMASDPKASYLPGSCTETNCTKLGSFGYKFHRFNGWKFAVKTGTTNYGFDGLMTSWSAKYAVATWVGNNKGNVNIQQYGAQMETLTEPVTRGLMEAAHAEQPAANWTQPAGVKTSAAYVLNRKISSNGEVPPSPTNDLYPAWYEGGSSKPASSATLDKVSGKIATSCTPELAKSVQLNGNAASWNIDLWSGGKASTKTAAKTTGTTTTVATDDVHSCNDPAPLVSVSVAGSNGNYAITVTASQQAGGKPLSGGEYTTAPAGTIAIQIAGQTICNLTIPASSSDVYTDSSCTYKPPADQQAAVTALVVDSVLFSGTGTSEAFNFQAAVASANLSFTGASHAGGKTTVRWSGGGGTVTASQGTNIVCSAPASDGACTSPANYKDNGLLSDTQGHTQAISFN
ncbi:penicillin-binding protein [Aeromicrobium sp.]|nr:penicillin-binding protein [Candidatus Saccharibacteria bacterium]